MAGWLDDRLDESAATKARAVAMARKTKGIGYARHFDLREPFIVAVYGYRGTGATLSRRSMDRCKNPGRICHRAFAPSATYPFDTIEVGVAKLDLAKGTPIYLYCAVGGRADKARRTLLAQGYTNVTNLGGWTTPGNSRVKPRYRTSPLTRCARPWRS